MKKRFYHQRKKASHCFHVLFLLFFNDKIYFGIKSTVRVRVSGKLDNYVYYFHSETRVFSELDIYMKAGFH